MVNVVEAFDKCKTYEYRYTYNAISYISPPTETPWSYDTYTEVAGIWKTSHGESFECRGGEMYKTNTSITVEELPEVKSVRSFGIGCSDGPLKNFKVLPVVFNGGFPDTIEGTGLVCQDKPNYWKNICPKASFSFRCYSKWTGPGNFIRDIYSKYAIYKFKK